MSSVFASHAARAASAIDGVLAEAFQHYPMRAGINGPDSLDPQRESTMLQAIFLAPGARLAQAQDSPGLTRIITDPALVLRAEVLPQGLRTGDQVVRVSSGKRYRLRSVTEAGFGRWHAPLQEIAP
jgi:hypothetical protein